MVLLLDWWFTRKILIVKYKVWIKDVAILRQENRAILKKMPFSFEDFSYKNDYRMKWTIGGENIRLIEQLSY